MADCEWEESNGLGTGDLERRPVLTLFRLGFLPT